MSTFYRRESVPEPDPSMLHLPSEHEPSAWFRGAIRAALGRADRIPHRRRRIVLNLSSVPFKAGDPEDRTCDRCRRFIPASGDEDFYPFVWPARSDVLLQVGLCRSCLLLEGAKSLPDLLDSYLQ
jgi:hypothetical protein